MFDRMLRLGDARVKLNTRVTGIDRSKRGQISVASTSLEDAADQSHNSVCYNAVIVTGPLQFSEIKFHPDLDSMPAESSFVDRHVTHFCSKHPLSSEIFNIATVPDQILTTAGINGVAPDFFSLTTSEVTHREGCEVLPENMYRLVTGQPVDDKRIAELLRLPYQEGTPLAETDVRWIHRHRWSHAYPEQGSNTRSGEVKLADGVYYTAAPSLV